MSNFIGIKINTKCSITHTFQKQLKQKQSPEFIKTLFELAVKNITVYPDKIKVALLVTQERFELPTP